MEKYNNSNKLYEYFSKYIEEKTSELLFKQEIEEKYDTKLKNEVYNLKKDFTDKIDIYKQENQKQRTALINYYIDEIFQTVLLKIETFVKTIKYVKYIENLILNQIKTHGTNLKIYLSKNDINNMFFVQNLREKTHVDIFLLDDKILHGGVRTLVEKQNILIDESFDEKIKEIKSIFSNKILGELYG